MFPAGACSYAGGNLVLSAADCQSPRFSGHAHLGIPADTKQHTVTSLRTSPVRLSQPLTETKYRRDGRRYFYKNHYYRELTSGVSNWVNDFSSFLCACAVVITLETQKCRKRAPRSVEFNFFIICDRHKRFSQNERRRVDLQNVASDFLIFA